MKTAISIPDPIFQTAERLAKRLGLSRSELYVRALSNYLTSQKGLKVTEQLNEIYSPTNQTQINNAIKHAQLKTINKEEW